MGYILLLLSILLFGAAFWLWHLSNKHVGSFVVTTSLFPEQEVKTYSISKFFLWQAKVFLLHRDSWLRVLNWVMVLMPMGVIGIGLILFIDRKIALGIFILIVVSSILYLIVVSSNIGHVIAYLRRMDRRRRRHSLQLGETSPDVRKRRVIKFSGKVTLPKQVYVKRNKSLKISIELMPKFELEAYNVEPGIVQDKGTGTSVTLRVLQETGEQFLQVELQAPAFTVAGEQKQKHLINFVNPHKVSYQWALFCPNPGNHPVFLIFSKATSSDTFKLGETTHEIRVRQLDHLSQTQVRFMTAVMTIIGTVSTVIGIVTNFPTLLHIFGVH